MPLVKSGARLSGAVAFTLYDTFGFPIDMTSELARERGWRCDLPAYETAMEEQRDRAARLGRFETRRQPPALGRCFQGDHSNFVGYDKLAVDGSIRGLREVRPKGAGRARELTLDHAPSMRREAARSATRDCWNRGEGSPPRAAPRGGHGEGRGSTVHRAEVVEGKPSAGP